MELHGKKIIITGGAQGIGAAVVRAFVSAGATISSMDRQEVLGTSVALAANNAGPGSVKFYTLEVTNRADVDLTFREAAHDMGGLDVLVNVAGVQKFVSLEDVDEDSFNYLFGVNVLGTMITTASPIVS